MNILFVNNSRGRGGGEEFLRDLLPGLAAKGANIGLICRPATPLEEMFQGTSVAIYPIKRSGLAAITSVFRIAHVIRSNGYEVINIQRGHDIIQTWIACVISLKKTVLLYTPQVPEFNRSRFLLNRMNRIITISRYIRDKLISFNTALSGRIDIIYYGIDLSLFTPGTVQRGSIRQRYGLSPETIMIGTVGDLWKNQIEFLDALSLLRTEFPDVRFALVGSPVGVGQIQEFKDRAEELGLTKAILWMGRLSKNEMLSFYTDLDVAVCTHRNEGFGIWILEVLSMGKPVIAFNEGGIRDSLESCPGGILVDGGASEMAVEIIRLLRDRIRYAQMGKESLKWVEKKFNKERMIDDYYHYFKTGLLTSKEISPPKVLDARQNEPMNILQIISKNDRYGAQRIFIDQAKVLQEMGHRVIVVGRGSEGYVPDCIRAMGIEYYGMSLKGIKDILLLRNLVKKNNIHIIHTTLDRADYFGVIVSRLTGCPVVSTMMVPRYHIGFRFTNEVIVLSNKQRDLLGEKGVRSERVHVIRPGIDVDRFGNPDSIKRETWRQKLDTDKYRIVFCHIASVIPRKAHEVSLELAIECKEKAMNPLLIIIGDPLHGEYYEMLEGRIRDSKLEHNVVFTGWTQEIPEVLSLSHFTVLPSENEALGIVLMEGMAAGTPIIARAGEGGAELIQEYGTGFLYKRGDSLSGLADALIGLMKDKIAYQSLSDKCRTIARKELSLQRFGEKLLDLYRHESVASKQRNG
ncbi:MAG TPA: glycosyltransferase family 4 protein [Nitrospirota bacterium]|nr:glycosyltransferase family 4 protein [Nitrospirota bacterium]